MAETIQSASQAELAAAVLTDVYTVPAATKAVSSTVTICNRTAGQIRYRLAVAVAGAADTPKQYLAFDLPLPGRTTDTWTIGQTLGASDVVRAYAAAVGISVNVFKVELT